MLTSHILTVQPIVWNHILARLLKRLSNTQIYGKN
jgi:hypothetical protein